MMPVCPFPIPVAGKGAEKEERKKRNERGENTLVPRSPHLAVPSKAEVKEKKAE